jgi:hypothetical protein
MRCSGRSGRYRIFVALRGSAQDRPQIYFNREVNGGSSQLEVERKSLGSRGRVRREDPSYSKGWWEHGKAEPRRNYGAWGTRSGPGMFSRYG